MSEAKISERSDRLAKLAALRERGVDPYPAKTNRDHMVAEILDGFDDFVARGEAVTLAGRIRALRVHGSLIFIDLEDDSGKTQVMFSQKELSHEAFADALNFLDVGDFIEATGLAHRSKTDQPSLLAASWRLLTKALRPLPDKWHGLQNEEERLRKRYLDILMNPEIKAMVRKRARFWNSMREFLIARGFLEVETPVLETTTGGADARPFVTHHHALDMDVYLRISAGELWQKRLMVAGFDKTFEIGRQFRNEGMSYEHLQDYTQMEFYWGYADYKKGMELVTDLYRHVAQETFGTTQFTIGKFTLDLADEWEVYDYRSIIQEKTHVDIETADVAEIEAALQRLEITYETKGFNITRAIDNLWKYCRKELSGPGFLVNVPVIMKPLAKRIVETPALAQCFQVIMAGSEMGNGYSELNDPLDQASRFDEQQKLREAGDDEAQMNDEDFVEALEYGMPPTCGFGLSERLFSFLCNSSARECQIFPLMKPKVQE